MSSAGTEFMEVCKMDRISIVVPCFNEEEALPVYYREMKRVRASCQRFPLRSFSWTMVPATKTLEILKQLNAKDGRCEYLSSPETLEKKQLYTRGLNMQVETMWQRWT